MPDHTTEIPEAPIEAAVAAAVAKWRSEASKDGFSGPSPYLKLHRALEAAAPILTAPLREELEEAKKERERLEYTCTDCGRRPSGEAELDGWAGDSDGFKQCFRCSVARQRVEKDVARADSAEEKIAATRTALHDFEHVEGEELDDMAAVAVEAFGFAKQRADSAEHRLKEVEADLARAETAVSEQERGLLDDLHAAEHRLEDLLAHLTDEEIVLAAEAEYRKMYGSVLHPMRCALRLVEEKLSPLATLQDSQVDGEGS